MTKQLTTAKLAALIKRYPDAVFTIDNDYWWMDAEPEENNPHDGDSEDEQELGRWEAWTARNRVCTSDDVMNSNSVYGGDVLQALAYIVGVQIESV